MTCVLYISPIPKPHPFKHREPIQLLLLQNSSCHCFNPPICSRYCFRPPSIDTHLSRRPAPTHIDDQHPPSPPPTTSLHPPCLSLIFHGHLRREGVRTQSITIYFLCFFMWMTFVGSRITTPNCTPVSSPSSLRWLWDPPKRPSAGLSPYLGSLSESITYR